MMCSMKYLDFMEFSELITHLTGKLLQVTVVLVILSSLSCSLILSEDV